MWMLRARYCPLCATELAEAQRNGRRRKHCGACGFTLYLNPASAAAGVLIDEDRRVLLIRRRIEPFQGAWALPAGYQEIDEDPRETVRREVREETGLEVEPGELLNYLHIPDDPRKPANLAVFLCTVRGGRLQAADDALEVAWFRHDELPEHVGFENRERVLEPLFLRLGWTAGER